MHVELFFSFDVVKSPGLCTCLQLQKDIYLTQMYIHSPTRYSDTLRLEKLNNFTWTHETTLYLSVSVCLSFTNTSIRSSPSVTFIHVEGFETAEHGLILNPRLSAVGAAKPIWHSLPSHFTLAWAGGLPNGEGAQAPCRCGDKTPGDSISCVHHLVVLD